MRSSVLGGQVVTKLNEQGQKKQTAIYLGNEVIAEQVVDLNNAQLNKVVWEYRDASGATLRQRNQYGQTIGDGIELDAVGGNAGTSDPYQVQTVGPRSWKTDFGMFSYGNSFATPCNVDGFMMECGRAMQMINNGSAAFCPNNNCGPRFRPDGVYIPRLTGDGFIYDRMAGNPDYDPLKKNPGKIKDDPKNPGSPNNPGSPVSFLNANFSNSSTQRKVDPIGVRKLTEEHQNKASLAIQLAKSLLAQRPECKEYITGLFGDAIEQLDELIYFNGFREGGKSEDVVAHAWVDPGRGKSMIYLNHHFFTDEVGGHTSWFGKIAGADISARALIILHELRHITFHFHLPGFEAFNDRSYDKNIYEKCFASPLPDNVAD